MTKQEAGKLVALALSNWPGMQNKDLRLDVTASLWGKLLADVSYSVAEQAMLKILITAKFWPTVSEIREAIDSLRPTAQGLPPADLAWEEVCRKMDPYKAAAWSHPAIGQAIGRLGGVRRLCESENTTADRAHFFKVYEAMSQREKSEAVNTKVLALVAGSVENLPRGGKAS
ncbi:MAG TPA: replicative helicase loader/inhibitor [Patescibacteria group bacterium]|nr:replicative helicase loader/inhibitor [Patescibacteria group bacterium]